MTTRTGSISTAKSSNWDLWPTVNWISRNSSAGGLVILASESKDFRLLAHLLRTLQHAGDPHLALRLLALYVEHYWSVAAPQNMAHKKTLCQPGH